ncbi:MAG TPA: hypothetical protein VIO80_16115 [Candidatus Dormibacteraeota bacterium]
MAGQHVLASSGQLTHPHTGSGMLGHMDTTWDTEGIRSQYPALKNGAA